MPRIIWDDASGKKVEMRWDFWGGVIKVDDKPQKVWGGPTILRKFDLKVEGAQQAYVISKRWPLVRPNLKVGEEVIPSSSWTWNPILY